MRYRIDTSTISVAAVALLTVLVFAFALRGLPESPTVDDIWAQPQRWLVDGPLELSPERGRFALLYAVAEQGTLQFAPDVARLAVPDLAIRPDGAYVSLFAPGLSLLAVPGYLLGAALGASVAGAFATVALLAMANMALVAVLARRVDTSTRAAAIAALAFGFGTPAFAYGVTLYQHHATTFLLLSSLTLLLRPSASLGSLWYAWFACAFAVLIVDNPNVFLMAPVGLYAVRRAWMLTEDPATGRHRAARALAGISAMLLAIGIPSVMFLGYNTVAYGDPLRLPGTLRSVDAMDATGNPVFFQPPITRVPQAAATVRPEEQGTTEKTALGFFATRNLYNGFFIHFLSPDRGMLVFAPAVLLGGIWGCVALYRRRSDITSLLLAIIGGNVLLYSLWGDPWGGWAFGSRYLIPTYAVLAVFLGYGLSAAPRRRLLAAVMAPLLAYAVAVNTLGAVTTGTNPPRVQVLTIEAQSGHEEKYTPLRNWEFLHGAYGAPGSKALLYQAWARDRMSAPAYYGLTLLLCGAAFAVAIAGIRDSRRP